MSKFLFFLFIFSTPLLAEQSSLNRLIEGNKRYVNDQLEHPNRGYERRKAVASTQNPFAVIVGCSDSRVAPEILFDQGLGDLFVVRVAGNVVGPLALDSIEYSVLHLGSKVILVMGHENCGAVEAVIKGQTKDIEAVAALIKPAVQETRKKHPSNLLRASTKANAVRMRDYLLKTAVIKKLVSSKQLEVHAAYYNFETGVVELLQ